MLKLIKLIFQLTFPSKNHLLSKNVILLFSRWLLECEAKIPFLTILTSFWYLFAMIKLLIILFISQGFSIAQVFSIFFTQKIWNLYGTDPAPFEANLFVHFFESKYIKNLLSLGSTRAYTVNINKQGDLLIIYVLSMIVMIHINIFTLKNWN